MLFLRASGRPMDRFASVPKTLLRAVCEAFQTPAVSIASPRSLYARRQTSYEHQAWARTYLGLQDLDAAGVDQLQKVLAISALEAAHPDDLAETARMWLYERRIVIPGPHRLADFAREAFDATEASMAATIEAGIGKAAVLKAIDWCYAPQPGIAGSRLEWLKTPPKRDPPSTMAQTLEKIRGLKELGVHGWPLDGAALSKQQAYAAHVQMRRPSMTVRIERQRQTGGDHLLSARDTAGADRHGAAGVTAQPGPVPPRRRAGLEGSLAQQRRDASAGPQSQVGAPRRVQALARSSARSPRLAGLSICSKNTITPARRVDRRSLEPSIRFGCRVASILVERAAGVRCGYLLQPNDVLTRNSSASPGFQAAVGVAGATWKPRAAARRFKTTTLRSRCCSS